MDTVGALGSRRDLGNRRIWFSLCLLLCRRGQPVPLLATWQGLVIAAVLATGLAAAQLLPVIEFIQLTTRAAAGGLHGIYAFSVEPYRAVELIWPNFGGPHYGQNTYWLEVIRLPGVYPRVWVPSLYLGGMTVILAAGALTLRQGPPWRVWLSAIALVSALGALGQYTSPIWATRAAAGLRPSPGLPHLSAELGPVDPPSDLPIRQDGFLKDGDGSMYWWLATFLPGFRQFRYPAKLFTFTSLALAALAGIGWDRVCIGRARRTIVMTGVLLVISLGVLAGVAMARQPIVAAFGSYVATSVSGPLDSAGGYEAIVRSLIHCLVVLASGLVLFMVAAVRPKLAGSAALLLTVLDLGAANSRFVMTVPQSMFDSEPRIEQIIKKAAADQSPAIEGPFRVHRMPSWNPGGWNVTPSEDREHELVAWEHDTIQSKYGINYGIEYTHTTGAAQLDDYEWYFSGFFRASISPAIAKRLGGQVGTKLIYFPHGPTTCGTRAISLYRPTPTAGATKSVPRQRFAWTVN